ncbi:FIST N-terminal domain-containing protein [Catenulispora yoronensis]|uniref:FIST N-terminal domain-containing protein n=1 Tax=Catenulispora yoronensis TaxID=450799 RepID=A0ABP5GKV0_9ACTN
MNARTVVRAHAVGPTAQALPALLSALDRGLTGRTPAAVLYFASSEHDPLVLAPAVSQHFPDAAVIGCSTAGEFTDQAIGLGGISAIALPHGVLHRAIAVLGHLDPDPAEGTAAAVRALEQRLGSQLRALDPDRYLGFLLVDGMHGSEEQVNDMLGNTAPLLDFVGGSAGDDFAFRSTWVAAGAEVSFHGVALLLCESAVPYRIVKSCSFSPTGRTLEVTEADVENRTVYEFDNRSATAAYAEAIGANPATLGAEDWIEHPVGLMIDGQPWIRSPQQVLADGGLRFYCQIMPGMRVEVMRSTDVLGETTAALEAARADLGGTVAGAVIFNCCLRRMEMDARGLTGRFPEALAGIPSAGFHTYGESWFGHVNQTLTGVVFGI